MSEFIERRPKRDSSFPPGKWPILHGPRRAGQTALLKPHHRTTAPISQDRNRIRRVFVAAMLIGSLSVPVATPAAPAGGGDLTFTPQNALPVVFSHNRHMKERGIKCSGCHYQFFQMARGSYRMEMEKITKGKFCGRCHNGRVSFDVQDPKNCACCHGRSSSSLCSERP